VLLVEEAEYRLLPVGIRRGTWFWQRSVGARRVLAEICGLLLASAFTPGGDGGVEHGTDSPRASSTDGISALACQPLLHNTSSSRATTSIAGSEAGRKRLVGALLFAWRSPQGFGADVTVAMQLVAELVAQAVARAELFDVEHTLRLRAEGLERVAAALTAATTVTDVADVITRVGLGTVGVLGLVARLDADGFTTLSPPHPAAVEVYAPLTLSSRHPAVAAVTTGRTIDVGLDGIGRDYPDAVEMQQYEMRRAVAVPVRVNGNVSAVIGVGTATVARPDDALVPYLEALAELCGQAMARATHYEQQRDAASVLQASMLPELSHRSDVALHACYAPAIDGLQVGGDWFDAFAAPSGAFVTVVGDVVGRGLVAASTMGQLRSATRALTSTTADPMAMIAALDWFVEDVPEAFCATLACISIDLASGHVRYAVAGHPAPLVLAADGTTRFLNGGRRPLLGVRGSDCGAASDRIAAGDRIVLYTDGLIERRDESIDAGMNRLREAVISASDLHGDDFINSVMAYVGASGQHDDACLLVSEYHSVRPWLHHALGPDPSTLHLARRAVQHWLATLKVDGSTVATDVVSDVVLAADELCANALEHGCRSSGDAGVVLEADLDADVVTVAVSDSGTWTPHNPANGGGRGLMITAALTDDVSFERRPSGTTVTFRKRLRGEATSGIDAAACLTQL
jgi:anti-sigma regulatory factor (Ser/Thr protein kinase)/GAF domain-containing protein